MKKPTLPVSSRKNGSEVTGKTPRPACAGDGVNLTDVRRRLERIERVLAAQLAILDVPLRRCSQDELLAIAEFAAAAQGYTVADLKVKSRRERLVFARNIIWTLQREFTSFKLEDIGAWWGGRDHTSILHGIKSLSDRMDSCLSTRQFVDGLRARLRNQSGGATV